MLGKNQSKGNQNDKGYSAVKITGTQKRWADREYLRLKIPATLEKGLPPVTGSQQDTTNQKHMVAAKHNFTDVLSGLVFHSQVSQEGVG